MASAKLRLDQVLVERGLFPSREKAQRAIMAGEVRVGDAVADKAGQKIDPTVAITVAEPPKYVSRGGFKMEGALGHFGLNPAGAICLDIGASTGGFTDCLLQHGATKVYAIDVGHSQLDWKIRSDPRVVVHEKLNARYLRRGDLPDPIDFCVIDVSFISLTLILPPAFDLLTPSGVLVALIKPQFELTQKDVGKGGIVKDPQAHQRAVDKIQRFTEEELGRKWCGVMDSPILGTEGNKEFLACLRP